MYLPIVLPVVFTNCNSHGGGAAIRTRNEHLGLVWWFRPCPRCPLHPKFWPWRELDRWQQMHMMVNRDGSGEEVPIYIQNVLGVRLLQLALPGSIKDSVTVVPCVQGKVKIMNIQWLFVLFRLRQNHAVRSPTVFPDLWILTTGTADSYRTIRIGCFIVGFIHAIPSIGIEVTVHCEEQ